MYLNVPNGHQNVGKIIWKYCVASKLGQHTGTLLLYTASLDWQKKLLSVLIQIPILSQMKKKPLF